MNILNETLKWFVWRTTSGSVSRKYSVNCYFYFLMVRWYYSSPVYYEIWSTTYQLLMTTSLCLSLAGTTEQLKYNKIILQFDNKTLGVTESWLSQINGPVFLSVSQSDIISANYLLSYPSVIWHYTQKLEGFHLLAFGYNWNDDCHWIPSLLYVKSKIRIFMDLNTFI